MDKKTKRIIAIAVAAVLLIVAAVIIILVVSTNSAGYRSISIAEIFGKVITQNSGKTYEAYKNMRLADGYALTTDPDSYTRMVLDDDKYVKLEQESHAVFEALGDAKKHLTTIRLEKGALTTEITKPLTETESYVVNTPNAVLAVRGTFFRVEVKQETNGDYYCDVYTYGGMVASHRIMPDGTHVDEEIVIPAGYKATIKMDEIITVYLEEKIEEMTDNIDPLYISEVNDDDLVSMYNASRHGHEMFLLTEELWDEISDRGIDLSEYKSVYDGTDIPPFISGDTGNSDSTADSSAENSESSSDISENTDSSSASDSSDQSGDPSDDNSSVSSSEKPVESSSVPSGSNDDNTHEPDPAPLPPQSSSASSPVSEPVPVESTPNTSINSVPAPDISGGSSSGTSSGTPVESKPSSSTDSESSDSSSDNTSDTPPEPPVHTHTPEETRVEPTCVDNGRITRKCSVCGELLDETAIPAKGHTEISETAPATCTEDGKAVFFCGVCEIILRTIDIPAAGHTIETVTIPATCTDGGKVTERCSVCNDTNETIIPATGHTFGEYISNNNATCLKDGTKSAVCGACGERKTIPVEGSMLPHTPNTVTVPSTCTVHGSETVICRVCEFIITPKRELPLAKHTEITETVDPTCTEDGKTTVTCSVCSEIISETIIDALEHDKITETEGDIETVKCTVCGEIISRTNTVTGVVYPVEISAEIFPDETFREYVQKFDTDGDGKLSLEESSAVTSIDVSGLDVDSLKGMDIFAELEGVRYTVHVEDGELDISEIGGIDASKISNVRGGETSGGTDIISGIAKGSEIGFDYDPGTGKSVSFTLVPDESSTFADETPEGVAINAENFPDEVFREYVTINFDMNGDSYLSQEECEAVTEMVITDENITSMEGIKVFLNLEKLNCTNTNITELDVSDNIKLTELKCVGTDIASLNLGENTELKTLWCMGTQITSLDLSSNMALTLLYCYGNENLVSLDINNCFELKTLRATDCQLSFIDISNNPNISTFRVDGNKHPIHVENGVFDLKGISGFDTSKVSELAGADMDENGVLSGITEGANITYTYDCDGKGGHNVTFTLVPDEGSTFAPETPEGVAINAENFPDEKFRTYVSTNFDTDGDGYLSQEECDAVTKIDVSGNWTGIDGGITSLQGIEHFTNLKTLDCSYNNELTELGVTKNTALTRLLCFNSSIGVLDVSNNMGLTELWCDSTKINTLDVSNNTALKILFCENTQITLLDVSKNTELGQLRCGGTEIYELDISNNTLLNLLWCEGTQIRELDISKNAMLTSLWCFGTKITLLDVSNNTVLKELLCHNTQIASLDVSNNTALTNLHCYNTQITSLDVSNNTALKELLCHNTQIASLDVSNNTALTNLHCYNTQITSLDVSNNTALKELLCHNTQIASLDVSNNTALTDLWCSDTQITSLDVSNNTALKVLYCDKTKITSLDVSNNTALTNLGFAETKVPFIDISNNLNIISLRAYKFQHPITVINGEFNLTTIDGFNISRIIDGTLTGANMDENGVLSGIVNGTNITYDYDCDGNSGHNLTFTLVPDNVSTFAPAALSDKSSDEDTHPNDLTVLPPDDTDTTPPPSSADTGADEILPEDATLPPEDIEGLRYLPLGILALGAYRKRKNAFRIRRKAEI